MFVVFLTSKLQEQRAAAEQKMDDEHAAVFEKDVTDLMKAWEKTVD